MTYNVLSGTLSLYTTTTTTKNKMNFYLMPIHLQAKHILQLLQRHIDSLHPHARPAACPCIIIIVIGWISSSIKFVYIWA